MYNKVMKKTVLVTIVSFLFLMLSSLVAWALRFADLKNCWLAWGIAAILLTISIVVALVVRTRPKFSVINLVLNAVAMGFFIRAWYMFRGFDNSFLTMFFVCLACMAYLWVFYAICYIPFVERHFFAFFIGYFIVTGIAYIFVIAFTQTTFVSTFGYYMIIEMGFLIALCFEAQTFSRFLRLLALSTFSIIIVTIIIAVLFVTGEAPDADFDVDFSGASPDADVPHGGGKRKPLKDDHVIMD